MQGIKTSLKDFQRLTPLIKANKNWNKEIVKLFLSFWSLNSLKTMFKSRQKKTIAAIPIFF